MVATDPDDEDLEQAPEQDLLVVLRLSNRQMGTAAERAAIEELSRELEDAVVDAGAGEFDGDEIGGGECILFFCGPDVDRLLRVLLPVLHRSPLCRGGHYVRMVADEHGRFVQRRTSL